MSGKTDIQWTDETWNPVVGCKRVSKGCDFCYAFQLHDQRYIAWKRGRWPSAPTQYHQPFSRVQLLPERLSDPLHWRKPRRVFVNSMSDLFHEDVPDTFIAEVFAVMYLASDHTFQILTKRPERMRSLLTDITFRGAVDFYVARLAREQGWDACTAETDDWPLPNVWLGTSAENQATADERIPLLLETPAAIHFLSCEPLLSQLDLSAWLDIEYVDAETVWDDTPGWVRWNDYGSEPRPDWIIIGGESGPRAREMRIEWVRDLVDQCRAAEVACFVKQLGSTWAKQHHAKNHHGSDPAEWSEHLRVREWPHMSAREVVMA